PRGGHVGADCSKRQHGNKDRRNSHDGPPEYRNRIARLDRREECLSYSGSRILRLSRSEYPAGPLISDSKQRVYPAGRYARSTRAAGSGPHDVIAHARRFVSHFVAPVFDDVSDRDNPDHATLIADRHVAHLPEGHAFHALRNSPA